MNEDQVNALAYAIAAIGKTDGGYSPAERAKHMATLQTMLQQGMNEVVSRFSKSE